MGYSFLSVNKRENFKTLPQNIIKVEFLQLFGSILRCHVAGGSRAFYSNFEIPPIELTEFSAVAPPMTLVRPSLSVGGGSRMRRP